MCRSFRIDAGLKCNGHKVVQVSPKKEPAMIRTLPRRSLHWLHLKVTIVIFIVQLLQRLLHDILNFWENIQLREHREVISEFHGGIAFIFLIFALCLSDHDLHSVHEDKSLTFVISSISCNERYSLAFDATTTRAFNTASLPFHVRPPTPFSNKG